MQLGTRIARTVKVAWNAAAIWCLYKIPAYARKWTGRPERSEAELAPTHARAAANRAVASSSVA